MNLQSSSLLNNAFSTVSFRNAVVHGWKNCQITHPRVRCESNKSAESSLGGEEFFKKLEAMAKLGKQERRKTSGLDSIQKAMDKVASQEIETAIQKYDLEEALFAEIDFVRINAFTFTAFGGNPAAVVYLPVMRDDPWLLNVSKEFNISETAYLVRRRVKSQAAEEKNESKGFGSKSKLIEKTGSGEGLKPVKKVATKKQLSEFDLRWFTPKEEVQLCGHATLASAHFLFSTDLVPERDTVTFHTLSGPLFVKKIKPEESVLKPLLSASKGEKNSASAVKNAKKRPNGAAIYEMDFPFDEITSTLSESELASLQEALPGVTIVFAGRTRLNNILAEVSSEEELKSLRPNFAKVSLLGGFGVGVTSASTDNSHDYFCRYFAPAVGIDEDPATGSLQCSLAPYWASKLSKTVLIGNQASERVGVFGLTVDAESKRVKIQGCAIVVMAGVLMNTTTSLA